jgi:hypothetical protein
LIQWDVWSTTNNTKYDTSNTRAIAEDELIALGGCVLNLSGLWGGARQVKHWLDRVADTKEKLASKQSLHMVHGLDVARSIVAVHQQFSKATGQRWVRLNFLKSSIDSRIAKSLTKFDRCLLTSWSTIGGL